MTIPKKEFEKFLRSFVKRRNRVRYSFQELGLMLAQGLNDYEHRGLYMRLAKYENPNLLAAAYRLARDSRHTNKGPIFMKHLVRLRDEAQYRLFVGVFVCPPDAEYLLQVATEIFGEKVKWENAGKLHFTLFFASSYPGRMYMKLTKLVQDVYKHYNYPNAISVDYLQVSRKNETMYVWGISRSPILYKTYNRLKTYFRSAKILQHFNLRRKFFPHITLARIKVRRGAQDSRFKDVSDKMQVSTSIRGGLSVAISELTKEGSRYTIHGIDEIKKDCDIIESTDV